MAAWSDETMAVAFGHPQPQSPLKHGHDAYFTNDYIFPPNDHLVPVEEHAYYRGHHHMAFVDHRQWQQAHHYGHNHGHGHGPWPHPYVDLGPPRSFTIDSTDASCTDSISARPSEEPRFEASYPHMTSMSSPYSTGPIYASPSPTHASIGADCTGVVPQDIQQLPDAIAEPVDQLDIGETMEVQPGHNAVYAASPVMMETGLPTPASETVSGSVGLEAGQHADEESDAEDNSGDYSPNSRKPKTRKPKGSPKAAPKPPLKSRHSKGHRVTKSSSKSAASSLSSPPLSTKDLSTAQCSACGQEQPNKNALARHMQTAHTRPFKCIFDIYGCAATFGAKNEWKRHCSTQHLRLSFFRCDIGSCVPQNATTARKLPGWDMPVAAPSAPGFNDFNRKDLFIQHHRRMHAPENINNGSVQDKDKFKITCERAARRCQVSARKPPPKTICGFCQAKGSPVVFEGNNAWETRMEHVGRHLESAKGDNTRWEEDIDLRQWLIGEGLLRQTERGQWRLTDLIKADEVKPGRR